MVFTSAATVLMVALLLPTAASAKPNWQGSISFAGAIPTGDFKDEIEDGGGGICADIVWSPQAQPFGLGVSFEYLIYGDQTRREPLSTTIPDIVVDVTTSNNIVQSHLFFRVGYRHGGFRPYADALVGFKYLYTRTSIDDSDFDYGDEIGSTNLDDWALSYGVRGGAMIRVYDGFARKKNYSVFIDMRAGYLLGGEADYLKEGSIHIDGTDVTYDISRSKTNLVMLHLGVNVDF
ncbi:hypothetical protein KQH51_05340 [bacterium]|nr:hypothetical protein [bacterium]MCB2202341.1 hypothetical protein [bacterium]